MKFRDNPLPKAALEILCFLLIVGLIPVLFLYEIFYVLPQVHEPGSFLYIFTICVGLFILFNIEGNLIMCMIVDTSVDYKLVKEPSEGSKERLEWRHCAECDRLAPPRSWHCKTCDVCILKRGHHCTFTGCCIGHRNYRYFICFMFYMVFGMIYTNIYNMVVVYDFLLNWTKTVNTLELFIWYPGYVLLYLPKCLLTVSSLSFSGAIASVLILGFHLPNLLRGRVCLPFKKPIVTDYDYGAFPNLRSVFGERMHLTWLFPLIESSLPEDGYNWQKSSEQNETKQLESKEVE